MANYKLTQTDVEVQAILDSVENFDNVPTSGSDNPVKSGGVYAALAGTESKMGVVATAQTADFNAEAGKYYTVTADSAITITLPTPSATTALSSIVFDTTLGASGGITFSFSGTVKYNSAFPLSVSTEYEVNALFNGSTWILMAAEVE